MQLLQNQRRVIKIFFLFRVLSEAGIEPRIHVQVIYEESVPRIPEPAQGDGAGGRETGLWLHGAVLCTVRKEFAQP